MYKFITLLLLLLSIERFSLAAPHPATSTSILSDPSKGHFFNSLGFEVKIDLSKWNFKNYDSNSIHDGIKLISNVANSKAHFILKTDDIKDTAFNFQNYSKRWVRDYSSFGFDLIGLKELKFGGSQAVLVDLTAKNKNKQIRQLILNKNKKITVLTCIDDIETFNNSLRNCNEIFNTYKWW